MASYQVPTAHTLLPVRTYVASPQYSAYWMLDFACNPMLCRIHVSWLGLDSRLGILGLPRAFSESGWLVGSTLLVLSGMYSWLGLDSGHLCSFLADVSAP